MILSMTGIAATSAELPGTSLVAELRSVNAQIEFLLRDALARRGQSPRPPPTAGDDHNSGSGRI